MKRLSDFKPLSKIELPGLGALTTRGLILIVGPNSAGKSQLLQDVYRRVVGEPRKLVVAKTISIIKPEIEPFIRSLEREGYIKDYTDENGNRYIRPLTPYLGTGAAAGQITRQQVDAWDQSYPGIEPSAHDEEFAFPKRQNEFLGYFYRFLVTPLFLDRRLVAANAVAMFDFQSTQPTTDLHALFINDKAKQELITEIQHSFGRAIWPDASRGSILCIRVSDTEALPTAEDRLSPRTMANFRTIETEGDGLKSYVATGIALLLGRRPVCIIDEPEMCLHPPQAYNLGRFIGEFGSSSETVTFVATHSSQILRGALQTADELQIVRLTRRGPGFEAHLVPSTTLEEVLKRPTIRAETVLDGIFAQAVAIVEADSDRTVYQAVWESLADEYFLDVHFTPVAGTGGIADTCNLYRSLKIPVAVIADLDVISDQQRFGKIVGSLTNDLDLKRQLAKRAEQIGKSVKALPPNISPDEIKQRLTALLQQPFDWANGGDETIRRELVSTGQRLDRMRRLKSGGVGALIGQLKSDVEALIRDASSIGLFLVPVGELEQWLESESVTVSKSTKWLWANEAAQIVRKAGPKTGDVWDFMRSIGDYLRKTLVA